RVNKEAKIYVRGDESLPYGRIMSTMGMIAKSGFEKVSLIAEAPSGSSSMGAQSAIAKKTA
ncbi:MAG: protein TolR, partial [Alphaproteobacteria bacterium]|nr:protein TolR [Alphaproteobacteria bacterium]